MNASHSTFFLQLTTSEFTYTLVSVEKFKNSAENKVVESSNPNSAKRRFPRRGFKKSIGLLYQGHFWLCAGEEVGEGGIGVNSIRELPEDALVILTFFVPGAEIAVIRSKVRYNTKARVEGHTRIGLQFLDASFDLKKKIRDYIAAKSEAEAKTDFDVRTSAA